MYMAQQGLLVRAIARTARLLQSSFARLRERFSVSEVGIWCPTSAAMVVVLKGKPLSRIVVEGAWPPTPGHTCELQLLLLHTSAISSTAGDGWGVRLLSAPVGSCCPFGEGDGGVAPLNLPRMVRAGHSQRKAGAAVTFLRDFGKYRHGDDLRFRSFVRWGCSKHHRKTYSGIQSGMIRNSVFSPEVWKNQEFDET